MKKITKILLALILCFLLINVNAKTVKINGEPGTDIYESGGSGSATFDQTTSTLTLVNYNGKAISISDFDGETVNIVVKGTNKIYNEVPGETPGIQISSSEAVVVNITGEDDSKLVFEACSDGIISIKGNMTIDNVDMKADGPDNSIIYLKDGDLFVKNSKIEVYDSNANGINADKGSITLDHVVYISNSCEEDVYIDGSGNYVITIKDSEFDIKYNDNYCFSGPEIKVYNSTFNIKDSKTIFKTTNKSTYLEKTTVNIENSDGLVQSADEVILKSSHINGDVLFGIIDSDKTASIINSTIDLEGNDYFGIYGFTVDVKDSDIKLDGFSIAFRGMGIFIDNSNVEVTDCGDAPDTPGLAAGVGLEIYDSTVKCVSKGFGVLLNLLYIDNSDVFIESSNSLPAIVVASGADKFDFDEVIHLLNVTIREKDLIKDNTYIDSNYLDFHENTYSFAKEELADSYDDSTLTDLFNVVASSIHFDTTKNPKTGDNISYYITLMILSIMTISSCYYVLNKE